jgi:predicted nucleic acid-binding protein
MMQAELPVYLLDTNVVSELRKKTRANPGVKAFFRQAVKDDSPLYVSVVSVGELRRGVEIIRYRGDVAQASVLESWLTTMLETFGETILPIDDQVCQVWGRLRVPHPEHALDKLIAATALIHDLTLVTRNVLDFGRTGVRLLNPFE